MIIMDFNEQAIFGSKPVSPIEDSDYKGFETLIIEVQENGDVKGTFKIDLNDISWEYELEDGVTVVITDYFPNYYLNDANEPSTIDHYPMNPAFAFKVTGPEYEEQFFLGIGINIKGHDDSVYDMSIVDGSFNEAN